MEEFIELFKKSIGTGFIDKKIGSELLYQPKLLVNNKKPRKKILTSLLHELETCESFFISVAFVTTSGVATIINTLQDLQERNIKGKLVVSQYLNFTDPEALRRLMQFDNIELRIATKVNAHSKGYIFKKKKHYNLIIGSSNLTQSALSSNKEWNLQVSAIHESKILNEVYHEFEKDFNSATIVTENYIGEYQKIYDRKRILLTHLHEKEAEQELFEPNKMQLEALNNLNTLREEGKNKALIISATGTGKTYLSAFDAESFDSKKLLFVVHRLNIAKKAMSTFKQVFGKKKSMGLYSGSSRELDKDFLFSTVQTISKAEHLNSFSKDHFDYIIIDESHRSGAQSYVNLINYFTPKFLLGMTATPERTDGNDIFQLFDHNIAYEIRLNRAMEEQMLCPFHYYGVSDLHINGKEQDDHTIFNRLTSDERINKIIRKSEFYGTDNGVCRGLIFTSKVNEANELSFKFNEKGYKTVALSGSNSSEERTNAIKRLESENESERLDYIFTVDIFNEGIDIPKVNQIIMLRPTESAIIFVQQLGRGLRKLDSKSYLTVIDFIGNHNNNYLIPVALYGDTTFNKDTLRKLLSAGSTDIPGVSTINFDKISKEKIYASIDAANMQLLRDLRKDYALLKQRLGRTPMMMDYVKHNSRNPFLFIKYSKSYYNFVSKVDDSSQSVLDKNLLKLLELFSVEINNGKRVEESLILKTLIETDNCSTKGLREKVNQKYKYSISDETINSCITNLNFKFIREKKGGKLVSAKEIYNLDIINLKNNKFSLSNQFLLLLENRIFKNYLLDSINYSIHEFDKLFDQDKWDKGFVLYRKYTRKDVFRILNTSENPVAQNVGGYLVSPDNSNCPIFVNYHKEDQISESTKYLDEFVNRSEFDWMSKSNRRITSNDVQSILGYNGSIHLPLFIKKNNDEGMEFYYMGAVNPNLNQVVETTIKNDKGKLLPVVKMRFNLENQVSSSLYNYLEETNLHHQTPDKSNRETTIEAPQTKVYQIPLYDLYAAAGSFSEMQTEKEFTLIDVPEKFKKEGYFAFKVLGESMNRRIPNGSTCIFSQPVVGSRNGKILLIENFDKQDEDLNSHFTVKTYTSSKTVSEEGWQHNSIILKPNSYDKSYEDIVLTPESIEEKMFNVVGEFVAVLEDEN